MAKISEQEFLAAVDAARKAGREARKSGTYGTSFVPVSVDLPSGGQALVFAPKRAGALYTMVAAIDGQPVQGAVEHQI